MCNLYHVAPRVELDAYLRRHVRSVMWPVADPPKPLVGPFDTGLFLLADDSGGLVGRLGQWGMIRPGQSERIEYKERPSKRPGGKPVRVPLLKNNARIESVSKMPAFRDAWCLGRRCLIPALWLQEPNWESGRNVWWHLRRADTLPWMIAGIWSEWTDPSTGELVPNFSMLTFNVNEHPLLKRLHRPEKSPKTGDLLPPEAQDKRGEASIEPADWMSWLLGDQATAQSLLVAPPAERFDQADALAMDAVLAQQTAE